MGARECSRGHTWKDRGAGRVVCQNGQVCLREDIQHRRDAPTGHHGGKTRSDQRSGEQGKKNTTNKKT